MCYEALLLHIETKKEQIDTLVLYLFYYEAVLLKRIGLMQKHYAAKVWEGMF